MCNNAQIMTNFKKKRIEGEFRALARRHTTFPRNSQDLTDIQQRIKHLASTIEAFESQFNYVPAWAYELLSKYNALQNRMILKEFQNAYC